MYMIGRQSVFHVPWVWCCSIETTTDPNSEEQSWASWCSTCTCWCRECIDSEVLCCNKKKCGVKQESGEIMEDMSDVCEQVTMICRVERERPQDEKQRRHIVCVWVSLCVGTVCECVWFLTCAGVCACVNYVLWALKWMTSSLGINSPLERINNVKANNIANKDVMLLFFS